MKASRHAEKAAEFVRILTKINKEISQEELSLKLGSTQAAISTWVVKRSGPSDDMVQKLRDLYPALDNLLKADEADIETPSDKKPKPLNTDHSQNILKERIKSLELELTHIKEKYSLLLENNKLLSERVTELQARKKASANPEPLAL
jgi:transcriptional regulator with XRE-family HTH domain